MLNRKKICTDFLLFRIFCDTPNKLDIIIFFFSWLYELRWAPLEMHKQTRWVCETIWARRWQSVMTASLAFDFFFIKLNHLCEQTDDEDRETSSATDKTYHSYANSHPRDTMYQRTNKGWQQKLLQWIILQQLQIKVFDQVVVALNEGIHKRFCTQDN